MVRMMTPWKHGNPMHGTDRVPLVSLSRTLAVHVIRKRREDTGPDRDAQGRSVSAHRVRTWRDGTDRALVGSERVHGDPVHMR